MECEKFECWGNFAYHYFSHKNTSTLKRIFFCPYPLGLFHWYGGFHRTVPVPPCISQVTLRNMDENPYKSVESNDILWCDIKQLCPLHYNNYGSIWSVFCDFVGENEWQDYEKTQYVLFCVQRNFCHEQLWIYIGVYLKSLLTISQHHIYILM